MPPRDVHEVHYFLGEFGYFALSYIGMMDRYVSMFPKKTITLNMFADYGTVLRLRHPRVIKRVVPWNGPNLAKYRDCFDLLRGTRGRIPAVRRFTANCLSPSYLLRMVGPGDFRVPCSSGLDGRIVKQYGQGRVGFRLSRPVRCDLDRDWGKAIVLFPRNRPAAVGRGETRNTPMQTWETVIQHLLEEYVHGQGYRLYQVGLPRESHDLQEVEFVTDIVDQISLLNNAKLLISSLSGLGQFAQVCGCNVLYLKPPAKWQTGSFSVLKYLGSEIEFGPEGNSGAVLQLVEQMLQRP